MKRAFKASNVPKQVLMIAMLFFAVFQSNGQQSKPADSGYVPVNGIKVYYEVYDMGDTYVAKITSPVLIISGDNDGLDKIELIKTYQLLGGAVSADLGPMPKSHLAIVPSQGHVSLMRQTKTILGYLDGFLK